METRLAFEGLAAEENLPVHIAQQKHTGDNAAMIAFAAWLDVAGHVPSAGYDLGFEPSLALAE